MKSYLVFNTKTNIYLKGSVDRFADRHTKAKKYSTLGQAKNAIHYVARHFMYIRNNHGLVEFTEAMATEANYVIKEFELMQTGVTFKV